MRQGLLLLFHFLIRSMFSFLFLLSSVLAAVCLSLFSGLLRIFVRPGGWTENPCIVVYTKLVSCQEPRKRSGVVLPKVSVNFFSVRHRFFPYVRAYDDTCTLGAVLSALFGLLAILLRTKYLYCCTYLV